MRDSEFGGQLRWHHAFRKWAKAKLGDDRQVYARRADAPKDATLVLMPDGKADEFRERAKSGALICPVEECPSERLTTVSCRDKRDHFRHLQKPSKGECSEHDPEYAQLATESLLRSWLADQDHVVDIEEPVMKYRDGSERVSYILAAALDDGSEVAFCYVDKPLGADVWEAHHNALRSRGIVGVWIFALTKTYFALPKSADQMEVLEKNLILDKPIYRRMRRRGSWPLLLNLEEEEWANLIVPGRTRAKKLGFSPPNLDRVVHVATSRLEEGRLCPYGIETPAISAAVLRKSSHN